MLTDDELELHERLGRLLGQVSAGPPPVTAVLRKGRMMRIGIQVATGAAIVVVGAAAFAGLMLAHAHRTPPAKPVRRHHAPRLPKESVTRLGPAARAGVIAAGDEYGPNGYGRWRMWVDTRSGKIYGQVGHGNTWDIGALKYARNTNRIGTFYNSSIEATIGSYLVVSPRVTRISVRYFDGQVLSLYPVAVAGRHWVGELTGLVGGGTKSYTAYDGRTLLGRADLTHGPVTWLRPGQRGPRRVTKRIGSGFVPAHSQHRWHAWVQAGPWGYCLGLYGWYAGPFSSTCLSPTSARSAGVKVVIHGKPHWAVSYLLGTAQPTVSYLELRIVDGTTVRVPAVPVDGQRFFAIALVHGQTPVSWAAYNQTGQELYGGTGTPALPKHSAPESITGTAGATCEVSAAPCRVLPQNWRT